MSAIHSKMTEIERDYSLNPDEMKIVEKCVNTYSNTSCISQIFNRMFNAIKSIFGCSDFQNAKVIMRTHLKDVLRTRFATQDPTSPQIELTLKNVVVKRNASNRAEVLLQDLIARNFTQTLLNTHNTGCCGRIVTFLFCPRQKMGGLESRDAWSQQVVDTAFRAFNP